MNEADTCRTYVSPKLKTAGWEDEYITEQLPLTETLPRPSPLPEGEGVRVGELPRKYYLDNVQVYIAGEQAFELDPKGNVLKTVEFTQFANEQIRRLDLTAEHLRQSWTQAEQRIEILNQLRSRGIDPDHLAHVTHHEEADALDLLLHVAYNAPLVTRRERADVDARCFGYGIQR